MPAHDVSTLLAELKRTDERAAEDARAAVDWLTGGDGLETITQLRVCEFLWYSLPLKWVCTAEERFAVAQALSRLLEMAGLERYAAMCVSPTTVGILHTYATSGDQAGIDAYEGAVEATGIVPPDTDQLCWASIKGMEEACAYEACSAAIEMSLAAGDFTVGGKGWKTRRRQVVDTWLSWQRAELEGQSWVHRVHAERIENWSISRGRARQELTESLAPRVARQVPAPPEAESSLAPLRWLLEQASGQAGLPLTERHNMGRAQVLEALARFAWDVVGNPRTEIDVIPLHTLRGLAQQHMRALRRSGRKLLLTPGGRQMLADFTRLWTAAASALIAQGRDEPEFDRAAREIELMLLVDGACVEWRALDAHVAEILTEEGWRDHDGNPPDADAVLPASAELWRRLWALGLLDDPDTPLSLKLNAAGQHAALAALRAHATRPRHTIDFD